jgi:serine-type D-Ala-D-Ala carboxypeptidase/endopeptidase
MRLQQRKRRGLACSTKMNVRTIASLFSSATVLLATSLPAGGEDFTNAIHAFLQQHLVAEQRNGGIVVGLVDEHGSRVVSCGRMDNGTSREVDGDTLFELGSITKTFTALLLQGMMDRGEMKLDDPVARFLPKSVKVPAFKGKEITLRHLATHTSGLPFFPNNLHPRRVENPYVDYTAEKMFAFLSGYKLDHAPGTRWDYSELGMQLLGYAIAAKAGTNYESLLVDRICGPLQMDSTRITLASELKERFAQGHNRLGCPVVSLQCGALVGGGALHSTANDLLKYVSANLGLTPSRLTPLMEKTHVPQFHMGGWYYIGLAWITQRDLLTTKLVCHPGATFGHGAFIGFDKARRRGVVVLASSDRVIEVRNLAISLLESEWQSDRRPTATRVGRQVYDSYVGEYQLVPTYALGLFTLRVLLLNLSMDVIWVPAGVCVGVVVLVLVLRRMGWVHRLWARWRPASARRRRIIRGSLALVGVIAAVLAPLIASYVVYAVCRPVMGVRREGDRLFLQPVRIAHIPSRYLSEVTIDRLRLPPITAELLPESEAHYFERLTGLRMRFSQDSRGKVTRLTLWAAGKAFCYEKISDQAPEAPKPPAAIKLDPKLYDAYVGSYEFGPDGLFREGINLTIRREGDRLAGQASDKSGDLGAMDIYTESETNFFLTIGVHLVFKKNEKREVTSVIRRVPGWPDSEGKRMSASVK